MNKKSPLQQIKIKTKEDFYLDEGHVKITAASVGISKER